MSLLHAQAFFFDALLGLLLCTLVASLLANSLSAPPSPSASLQASAACYDLANYIYSDADFYLNITAQLRSEPHISNSSLALLRGRLFYYGKLLDLSAIDFSLDNLQNEHITVSDLVPSTSEKCCFPLPADDGRRVPTACLEVFA